jgi:hypothetical protein
MVELLLSSRFRILIKKSPVFSSPWSVPGTSNPFDVCPLDHEISLVGSWTYGKHSSTTTVATSGYL